MKWFLKCMRNYANFRGRARRQEYWMFVLIGLICIYGVWFLGMALTGDFSFFRQFTFHYTDNPVAVNPFETYKYFFTHYWYCSVFGLIFLMPGLAVTVRRLHDTGRSGWLLGIYWLVYILTMGFAIGSLSLLQTPNSALLWLAYGFGLYLRGIVFLVAFIVWLCLPGDKGPNKYGPDPKSLQE